MIKRAVLILCSLPSQQAAICFLLTFFGTCFGYFYARAWWPDRLLAGTLLVFSLSCAAGAGAIFAINWLGSMSFKILAGPSARWTLREQLQADISVTRNLKMNQKYDEALNRVDSILLQDPDFPEALFLKSQILWEGFKDGPSALEDLQTLIATVPDGSDPLRRWAVSLCGEIKAQTRKETGSPF